MLPHTYYRLAALFLALIPLLLTGKTAPCGDSFWSIPAVTVHGEDYASIYDLVTVAGTGYSFDPVVRRGRIFRKEHSLVFLEDCSAALADGKLLRANFPVLHHKNETLLPEEIFLGTAAALFPECRIEKKNGKYTAMKIPAKGKAPAVKRPSVKSAEKEPEDDAGPSPAGKTYNAATSEKIGFIVLDAGHGGKDPGAIGKGKTYEKNITLSMIKKVGAILGNEHKELKIYYTRTTDVFVELGGRTEIANRKLTNRSGGLFVSIHVNASVVPKMNGFETYYLSQTPTNSEARSTAALENNVIVLENPGRRKSYDDVEYIEALMATTQIQKESRTLAQQIQKKMSSSIKAFPSRGVKTADFFVLRGSLMPAVLVEIGYITNKAEVARLTDDNYQDSVAASIAGGIGSFLKSYGGSN